MRSLTVFVLVLAFLSFGLLASASNQVVSPAFASGTSISLLAVDTNSSGNSPTSVGTIESCTSYPAGSSFSLDIVARDVPANSSTQQTGGLAGFGFNILYDSSILNVSSKAPLATSSLLGNYATSSISSFGDPGPDIDGDFRAIEIDSDANFEDGSGVLIRLTFSATGTGTSNITLSDTTGGDGDGFPDVYNSDTTIYSIDSIQHGQIAIGGTCSGGPGPTLPPPTVPPTTAPPTPQPPTPVPSTPVPTSARTPSPIATPMPVPLPTGDYYSPTPEVETWEELTADQRAVGDKILVNTNQFQITYLISNRQATVEIKRVPFGESKAAAEDWFHMQGLSPQALCVISRINFVPSRVVMDSGYEFRPEDSVPTGCDVPASDGEPTNKPSRSTTGTTSPSPVGFAGQPGAALNSPEDGGGSLNWTVVSVLGALVATSTVAAGGSDDQDSGAEEQMTHFGCISLFVAGAVFALMPALHPSPARAENLPQDGGNFLEVPSSGDLPVIRLDPTETVVEVGREATFTINVTPASAGVSEIHVWVTFDLSVLEYSQCTSAWPCGYGPDGKGSGVVGYATDAGWGYDGPIPDSPFTLGTVVMTGSSLSENTNISVAALRLEDRDGNDISGQAVLLGSHLEVVPSSTPTITPSPSPPPNPTPSPSPPRTATATPYRPQVTPTDLQTATPNAANPNPTAPRTSAATPRPNAPSPSVTLAPDGSASTTSGSPAPTSSTFVGEVDFAGQPGAALDAQEDSSGSISWVLVGGLGMAVAVGGTAASAAVIRIRRRSK